MDRVIRLIPHGGMDRLWFGVDLSAIGVLGMVHLLNVETLVNVYILGATAVSITITIVGKIVMLIKKKRDNDV